MMIKTSCVLFIAALLGFGAPAFAQEQFGTPEAAVEALVAAARSGDGDAVLKVLGPDGKPIVSSGDPVADSNIRQDFVSAYDAKHAIEMEGDGTQTLVIGSDDWPFPIPLINKAGNGSSTPTKDWMRSFAGGLAAMNFRPSRSVSLMFRRRTNMPHSIRRVRAEVSTHKGS